MGIKIRPWQKDDLAAMIDIWNDVVKDGEAFPQEDPLDRLTGEAFFQSQTHCGVAAESGSVLGFYILHPNNVGRCGHIANASYAVRKDCRGRNIGEQLVLDSLRQAKHFGFSLMQFNAVVESNHAAKHLYEKLGFRPLGKIPNGFRMKDGHFETICPYYLTL